MNETYTTALLVALCAIIVLLFYLCELVSNLRIAIIVAEKRAMYTKPTLVEDAAPRS